jgi:subtilisin family serine protease
MVIPAQFIYILFEETISRFFAGSIPIEKIMKFYKIPMLAFIIAAACISLAAQKPAENFVPNEVLIKFAPQTTKAKRGSIGKAMRADIVEQLGDTGWFRAVLPAGLSPQNAAERYAAFDQIVSIQPNFYYHLVATPNDPEFDDPAMYGLTKISAPLAWDIETGSSSVVIANIDTGVRYTHQDLAANMWTNAGETPDNGVDDDGNGFIDDYYGYDFRYNDPDPWDQHGHGTHTSGTIGAVGNNGIGIVGVSWNVKIMAIKIYSAAAGDTTSAMLINAYNYVRMMRERGVNIVATNNSYGGCAEACGYDQATKDAIDAMGEAGILNVFAAGNSGVNVDITPEYPGSYDSPSIITIGASNVDDNRVFNYGVVNVDLAAPGVGIRSTTYNSDSSYGNKSGTSMATPHVTGTAALIASHYPKMSAASIKATLMNTVDQLPQWNGVVKSGGRLNAFRALQQPTICSFEVSQTQLHPKTKGGYFTIGVTAPENCDYAVKSDVNWIHFENNSPRSGNASVTFRVGLNSRISRTGTIRIGDRTITVTQTRGT